VHHGYAPQRGVSSGAFYTGWVTRTPLVLTGNSKTRTPPIILLINAQSTSADAIAGLQAAGMAYVVQEGAPPATGDTATISLGDGAVLTMATTELVAPDGAVGFVADQVVPIGKVPSAEQIMLTWKDEKHASRSVSSASQAASDGKDNSYPEMRFPSYEYRLLALFRYWNVINYFFPYKGLIGSDWNEVLPRYIARLESNRTALDYETTLRELSVETHDRHAYMGPTLAFFEKVGAFIPPVVLRFVDGQWMVSAVLDTRARVRVGDVVLGIDGKSASSRQVFFARMYPASTPQAQAVAVSPYLLRGQKDSIAHLTVRGIDGGVREVEMRRSLDYFTPVPPERTTPAVAILPSGVGYVDLTRLQSSEVQSMFETIRNTSATIFDMRGYPNGTAWAITPRLSKTRNPVSALFSIPAIEAMAIGDGGHGEATYQFEDRLPDAKGTHYDGRVVMLIDERAVSQAEHTCLMFEAATDVTFIGTPTSGTDGDTTNLVLPGGITASFSGDSVRHANGRQLQRIGIQPTILVVPTVAGLAAGRDEVLEAAVAFLAKQSATKAH
jgi:C-terminal processing protease CtpA/Prc